MGANQSQDDGLSHDPGWTGRTNSQTNKEYHTHGDYNNHRMVERQRKSKAKPSPPSRPRFINITHNSITLSWQNPQQSDGNSIIAYTVEIIDVTSGRDRLWRTLTKSCQGTTYEARHLEPNTAYVFRVRSENIYGIGKPSPPSEICITKMYDTFPVDSIPISVSKNFGKSSDESAQKRQYGFNMHIGGNVKSILNHSDIVIDSVSVSSQSSSAFISNRSLKSQTLLRNNIHRTSLPSTRKISAPILLPGTGNNSLNRMRESRRSLRTDILDTKFKSSARDSGISGLQESLTVFNSNTLDIDFSANSGLDCKRKDKDCECLLPVHQSDNFTKSIDGDSGKGSKNSLCDVSKASDDHSCSISTDSDLVNDINEDINNYKCNTINNDNSNNLNMLDKGNEVCDDIYKLKEEMKNLDLCNRKLTIRADGDKGDQPNDFTLSTTDSQKGYYDSLDNPWERGMSLNGVSQQILAAPLSDDVKMALYTRNVPEARNFTTEFDLSTEETTDFRTLRNVLQSNNMIVKTCRSLPDVAVMVNGEKRSVTKGKLSTIADAGEEDGMVRITTL